MITQYYVETKQNGGVFVFEITCAEYARRALNRSDEYKTVNTYSDKRVTEVDCGMYSVIKSEVGQ